MDNVKIKDLPDGLKELALKQQELQGNPRNEDVKLTRFKEQSNFNWHETIQGRGFWNMVHDGDFEGAKEIYDWESDKTLYTIEEIKDSAEFIEKLNNVVYAGGVDPIPVEQRGEEKKIRVFETGSKRDSAEGKPRVSDLKPYTRLRFGYHMLLGSLKYGEGNFELGQPDDSTLASMHRHLAMYELGDRSECHLSALLFGIQLLMQNEQREGVEVDRYFKLLKDKL